MCYRHSNVSCTDDAASCIREAALKFADQNVEAPLDLILLTGRKALARNVNSLVKVLKLKKPDDVQALCQADPLLYVYSRFSADFLRLFALKIITLQLHEAYVTE